MKKIIELFTVVAFIGSLSFLGYKTIAKEPVEYSDFEYRNLSQRPEFSFKAVIDKEYTPHFETYFQDQFYKRIGLSKYFYSFQMHLNKPLASNVLLGDNGWGRFAPKASKDHFLIKQSIDEINSMNDFALANNIPLYLSMNPFKDYTLSHVFPHHPATDVELEVKQMVLDGLDEEVKIIDHPKYFKESFTKKELENMFYKTDHHWNHLGAYESYHFLISQLREEHKDIPAPLDKEELRVVCADRENSYFLGSVNRSLLRAMDETEEPLCAYSVQDPAVFSEVKYIDAFGYEYNGMEYVFHTKLNDYNQTYANITSGDLSQIILKTKNPPNDLKVLVIKDSYTNALFPYTALHFKETHILDMRHYKGGSAQEYAKEHGINLIILSHNEVMTGETFKYSGVDQD